MKYQILLLVLIAIPSAFAYDFSISVPSQSYGNPYHGDIVQLTGIVTANNNSCDINCQFQTEAGTGTVSYNGHSTPTWLSAYERQEFPFPVRAEGSNGNATTYLTVTCKGLSNSSCASPLTHTLTGIKIKFRYLGDGKCDTDHEDCTDSDNEPSCECGSRRECNPDSTRSDKDTKGCASYCGNGVRESAYENCNNCPSEAGKCEGEYCTSGNECEGRYCVHNKCSKTTFITGDSFCDSNSGETCLNSQDCACPASQRCGYTGRCEYYCGNNLCDPGEERICLQDCPGYCGDGMCNRDRETCGSCIQDCGACPRPSKEEELLRNAELERERKAQAEAARKAKIDAFLRNPAAMLSILALIILIVVGAILYRNRTQVKGAKRCHKCHRLLITGSRYCPYCGAKN